MANEITFLFSLLTMLLILPTASNVLPPSTLSNPAADRRGFLAYLPF